jgi:hypothetical protein
MNPALYLVLAHCLLDYPLQGDFLAQKKKDYLLVLLAHSAIWGLGCAAVLDHFSLLRDWMVPWLVFGHMLMDWVKCHSLANWICSCAGDPLCEILEHRQNGKMPWRVDPLGFPLVLDQAFHLLQLWVCLCLS